jgi:hypothetical protein
MNTERILTVTDFEKESAHKKGTTDLAFFLEDSGGRRAGLRNRRFSYDAHMPERRSDAERRSGEDRRATDVSQAYQKERRGVDRRIFS